LSATDTSERRVATPLKVGIGAALGSLAILAAVLLAGNGGSEPPRPEPRRLPPPGSESRALEQASWKIRSFAAGGPGRITKRDRRDAKRHADRIAGLVRHVYDALFLSPRDKKRVLKARFTRRAARALYEARRIGLPARADNVKTLARAARIGVDASSHRNAVVTVTLRARGVVGARSFRVRHRSILWLQRAGGRWNVIAFDASQRRVA
jgi:hypothetical protein